MWQPSMRFRPNLGRPQRQWHLLQHVHRPNQLAPAAVGRIPRFRRLPCRRPSEWRKRIALSSPAGLWRLHRRPPAPREQRPACGLLRLLHRLPSGAGGNLRSAGPQLLGSGRWHRDLPLVRVRPRRERRRSPLDSPADAWTADRAATPSRARRGVPDRWQVRNALFVPFSYEILSCAKTGAGQT